MPCDTFVALSNVTATGEVIFGKNSDRPQGEKQDVVLFPSENFPPDSQLKCTYISIPQVEKTLAVLLSKPNWMWGAEMGANEKGLVIGNEAVWTIEPDKPSGLLGMDLLRLGLERAKCASEGVSVLTTLLKQHGQGGNCAEHFAMTYHNSFILADPQEAWVLETAGKYWVAEKVTQGTRSISNNLSIRNGGDLRHPEVLEYGISKAQCKGLEDFDFAQIFSSGGCSVDSREGQVRHMCKLNEGKFSVETAKKILREHNGSVCMHGGFESTGSQISTLSQAGCKHWFIEAPLPCKQEYILKGFE